MGTAKPVTLKWWQIALLAIAASALGGLASLTSHKKDKQLYNKKLKQAPWAPPSWLFAPAWTVNNFFLLTALQRILNSNMPQKNKLLAMQAVIWLIFFSFGYIYFNKKSTVLAALWTTGDAALAATSFITLYKVDGKTAYNYAPLLVWTAFASTLAGYQALTNADPVLKTKALLA